MRDTGSCERNRAIARPFYFLALKIRTDRFLGAGRMSFSWHSVQMLLTSLLLRRCGDGEGQCREKKSEAKEKKTAHARTPREKNCGRELEGEYRCAVTRKPWMKTSLQKLL
jgi:hypothetical protein